MPPSEKTFKQLQAEWDLKLKKSGFQDSETRDGNLKRWHGSDMLMKYNFEDGHNRQIYFEAAGRFLYDYKWDSLVDKRIWELHCEGLPVRHIVRSLKGSHRRSKSEVHRILQRLTKAMVSKWRE